MARSTTAKSPTKSEPKNTAMWTEFVTIAVSAEQAEAIFKVYSSADVVEESLTELLLSGYRVSFSYSPQTDAVTMSMTCKAEGDPNLGKTVTSFASTWYQALCVGLYKHNVISKQLWGGSGQPTNRPIIG